MGSPWFAPRPRRPSAAAFPSPASAPMTRPQPLSRRDAVRRALALSAPAWLGAARAGAPARAGAASAAALPASGLRPDCTRPLTLGLHEHGLLYESQTGAGIDKDIAEEMARRTGCHLQTMLLPRERIWHLIESGALDFSLSGIANAQRDTYAEFSWYVSNRYYLLVRGDLRLASVDAFLADPRLKLGVIRSFRYGPKANAFVDALERQGRLVYATTLDPLFEVLLDGRVQGMIIEPFDYPTLGAPALRARTAIMAFDDPPVPHGLIMSRRSLPADQRRAWAAVIQSMRRDGTMLRIFEKYFPRDLARRMTDFRAGPE